jgi:hypothetical protein
MNHHLKGFEHEAYEKLILALNQVIHNGSSPQEHKAAALQVHPNLKATDHPSYSNS